MVFGLFILARYPEANQYFLKGFVPGAFIYILIISKPKILFYDFSLLKYYLALLLFAIFSLFYTVNIDNTITYLQGMLGNIIIMYITIFIALKSKSRLKIALPVMICLLIHLYFGATTPVELSSSKDIERIEGIAGNANALSFNYFYGIIIASFLIILAKNKSFLKKIIYLVIVLLFIFGIFFTGSRKTLFALAIFIAIYFSMQVSLRNSILILLSLVISYFSIDYLMDIFRQFTPVGKRLEETAMQRGIEIRGELISDGIKMFLSSPLFGVGLGSFKHLSSSGLMAHNDYIEILATMGIIGISIYLMIYYSFFRMTMFLKRNSNRKDIKLMSFYLSFLISYMFLGMGRPSFLSLTDMFILALINTMLFIDYSEYRLYLKQT